MRILHTSDWHLGRTLHGVDLLTYQAAYLDHLVDVVRDSSIDAVLVAGDVYDRAVPPVEAVELLADALSRLTAYAHVVLTPGNHDSAIRLGFGARLFTERASVRCRVRDVGTPVTLRSADDGDSAWVYALPYLEPESARYELADDGSPGADVPARPHGPVPARSHEAVMAAAMQRVRADLASRRAGSAGGRVPAVVVAHAFVVGGAASDSERDIRVGGVDSVPAGVFDDVFDDAASIDYVALGHLHGPQRIGRGGDALGTGPMLRYAGSPLAYSFSEVAHRKSSAIVGLSPGGVVGVELVPTPVPRRLADVVGTLAELQGHAFDAEADAWVRVTVTDPSRPGEMYAAVKERFPHALVIQHRTAQAQALAGTAVRGAREDPLEIATQFLLDVGGRAPREDELRVLRDAYEAVTALDRSA